MRGRVVEMGTRTVHRWLPLVVVALVACGGDGGPTEPPGPSVVDDALVGTWVGPIEEIEKSFGGVLQSGTMTMNLNADGSMSVSVSNPFIGPIDGGTWGVADGNEFGAIGSFGTFVSFDAPRSTTRLDGTWSALFSSGTFSVTNQGSDE